MKNKFIFPIILLVLIITSAFTAIHISGNIFTTGSPFDGSTCALCHSGGATTPTVSISSSPAFGVGNTYVAGQSYTISVNCSGSYSKYGFNAEVLDSNSPITVNDAGICGPPVTSNCAKFAGSSGNPTNYTHNAASGTLNAATFSFKWTAPASGSVFIYAAGLGVDLGGTTLGDKVKAASVILTSSTFDIVKHERNEANLNVFPNPASDNVRIAYTLSERSRVLIKLYTINGEFISDLLNENQSPGQQSVDIRLPIGLAKGLYFIKLNMNDKFGSQKLMVL